VSSATTSSTYTGRARRNLKRERLIRGARQVTYQQGVERTSLAEIARVADVPVGNIYYYFKTKDQLVSAAVDSYVSDRTELLDRLAQEPAPRDRLKAFLEALSGFGGFVAEYGCPFGTLSAELDKRNGPAVSAESQALISPMVDWAEQQFAEIGAPDAYGLAVRLIAGYEGAALLTHSQRDPDLLREQTQRLQVWIDELADTAAAALTPLEPHPPFPERKATPMSASSPSPAADELSLTNFVVADDIPATARFYSEILGGTIVREIPGGPTIIQLANGWITINNGGGPTPDKPTVTLEQPQDLDRVDAFLNIRVGDIQAVYREWTKRGAQFLTEPIDNGGREMRCYLRDPAGHLIEVGQAIHN
jgi:TetR/AcrR family transcriptional regulator, transcriptional repressor for nem operon